jgi:hypothetical protein
MDVENTFSNVEFDCGNRLGACTCTFLAYPESAAHMLAVRLLAVRRAAPGRGQQS